MKKIFALIVIVALFPISAFADWSEYSFNELVEIRKNINLAIMESDETKAFIVSEGLYKFGEDIPAGLFAIEAAESGYNSFGYSDKLGKGGYNISFSGGTHAYFNTYTEMNYTDDMYLIVESGNAKIKKINQTTIGFIFGVIEKNESEWGKYSLSELQEISTEIGEELKTREEYQSVIAPYGVYRAGKDIPAGRWTISYEGSTLYFGVSPDIKTSGALAGYISPSTSENTMWYYLKYNTKPISIDLKEGHYLQVNQSGPVRISTYIAEPTFDLITEE